MATRSRKEEQKYALHRKTKSFKTECSFCAIHPDEDQFVSQTKSFMIVKNIYPYTLWDSQGVEDHLLLIPKTHTNSLSSFDNEAALEYVKLLSEYEKAGYDISARGYKSNRKTVTHHHTHLIKLNRKTKKFIFLIRKPYIRIVK